MHFKHVADMLSLPLNGVVDRRGSLYDAGVGVGEGEGLCTETKGLVTPLNVGTEKGFVLLDFRTISSLVGSLMPLSALTSTGLGR